MKKLTALILTLALALTLAPAARAAGPTAKEALDAFEKFIADGGAEKDKAESFNTAFKPYAALYVDFDRDGVPELLNVYTDNRYASPLRSYEIFYVSKSNGSLSVKEVRDDYGAFSVSDYPGAGGGYLAAFGKLNTGEFALESVCIFPHDPDEYTYYTYSGGKITESLKLNDSFLEDVRAYAGFTEIEIPANNRFALYTPPVSGPAVQLSTQNLTVNGKPVDCEKYNIDGSNYFKLRDLAKLLDGTANRFEVDFADNTVAITTGKAYTGVGGELSKGGDKSSTAVVSSQKVSVNGAEVTDIAAYNIGGNNYFKLRDLGDKLGFKVDYDAATATAVVTSTDYVPGAVGSCDLNEGGA